MVKITSADEGLISVGPWGGLKGEPWAYKPDGRITQIIVHHGVAVDSISFTSQSHHGSLLQKSQKFGGSGANRTDKVSMQDSKHEMTASGLALTTKTLIQTFKEYRAETKKFGLKAYEKWVSIDGVLEYLTTVSMTVGEFDGQSVIRSITFHTNLTKYGPFGSESGTSVSIPMEGGVILGFHGRAGKYLNAIGLYVAPKLTRLSQIGSHLRLPWTSSGLLSEASSSMNSVVQRDAGPWGDQRGRPWDDGVFLAVKQITLRLATGYGFNVIQGIELKYERRDGCSFTSQHGWTRHSGSVLNGSAVHQEMVTLESASGEIIVGVEGFYGSTRCTDGFEVITSISIYTNKRKFGPFGGNENGTHFSSMLSGGKVVGFFGRCGTCLNAIGIHTEYC